MSATPQPIQDDSFSAPSQNSFIEKKLTIIREDDMELTPAERERRRSTAKFNDMRFLKLVNNEAPKPNNDISMISSI